MRPPGVIGPVGVLTLRHRALVWFGLALVGLLVAAGCGPFPDRFNLHDRADTPAGALGGARSVGQSFIAGCDGLTALDLQVAVYPQVPRTAGRLIVTLARAEAHGRETAAVVTGSFAEADLQPNAWVRLAFPPVRPSAGSSFVVTARSTDPTTSAITLWASERVDDRDTQRFDQQGPRPGVLVSRTYCDTPPISLIQETADSVQRAGWLWPLTILLCMVPGLGIASWLAPSRTPPLAMAGHAIGWSVISLTLGLWILTPLHWSSALGPLLFAVGGGSFFVWHLQRRRRRIGRLGRASERPTGTFARERPGEGDPAAVHTPDGADQSAIPTGRATGRGDRHGHRLLASRGSGGWPAIAGIATLGALALRMIHARNLTVPMWVDSPQHVWIVQRILAEGGLPATYGPLIPSQAFDYHFGFHAVAAVAAWSSGAAAPLATLVAGQVLSALSGLAVYLLTRELTRSDRAAAVAAVLVGLVTSYPTYYVTWGRYPELAGLVVLPAAFASVRSALESDWRWRDLAASSVAGGALILIHPRVAIFTAALITAWFITRGIRPRPPRGSPEPSSGEHHEGEARVRAWLHGAPLSHAIGRLMVLGGGAVALVSPWLTAMWTLHRSQTVLPSVTAPSHAITSFPLDLVVAGDDRYLAGLALLGLLIAVYRQPRLAATLILWSGIVLIAADPPLLGLPINLWVNANSIAIAAFVPIVVLVGSLVEEIAASLGERSRRPLRRLALPVLILALAGSRFPTMVGIVSPCCGLIGPGDSEAIAWVRDNTPAEAKFVIDGYIWQDRIWAGSDAGYWLPVLADRATTLPPLFYAVGPEQSVRLIQETAAQISQAAADPSALARTARANGAAFVFVGSRGGRLDPVRLAHSEEFRLLYRSGGAWVFAVVAGAGPDGEVDGVGTPVTRADGVADRTDPTPVGAAGVAGVADGTALRPASGEAVGLGACSNSTLTGCTPIAAGTPKSSNAAGLRSSTRG